MERRFSINDFEQSLKEHADEFKMIPSKRVWHGIYNDLHPGRRWPSITISLLLICTLVFIGFLNTHTGSHVVDKKLISSKNSANTELQKDSKNIQKSATLKTVSKSTITANVLPSENLKSKSTTNNIYNPAYHTSINVLPQQNLNITFQPPFIQPEKGKLPLTLQNINDNTQPDYNSSTPETIKEKIYTNTDYNLKWNNKITATSNNLKYTKPSNNNIINKQTTQNFSNTVNKKLTANKKKRNDNISWTYFIRPQINTVSFKGRPIEPLSAMGNMSLPVTINQKQYKVLHNAILGFGTGLQMSYLLGKKLSFTSGFGLTYSGYNIISNEVHPTFANLFLKDPATGNVYSKSYITHYGDGTGQTPVSIRNYNWQASLPIGLQYEFWGNNKIKLNAAADFESSVVIKSEAYLLSSDGKNYVTDPDLIRKINMNSNFGLFVSFVSAKFKWQIGPNARYQWLSTYKTDYTIQEHLIDYGIKIGISPIKK